MQININKNGISIIQLLPNIDIHNIDISYITIINGKCSEFLSLYVSPTRKRSIFHRNLLLQAFETDIMSLHNYGSNEHWTHILIIQPHINYVNGKAIPQLRSAMFKLLSNIKINYYIYSWLYIDKY